uniref:Exocyst complex component 7 n=1 Tax=Knipowitschia caucasica TaxID=637954 RepID=A0AAV2LH02_KNICA
MGPGSTMVPTEDSARKREIEEKLKQEQETLSFIRENLEKSDQLTKGMVSILSSFERRLMQLENSIIPVHKQTENLQRLQDNVDKTMSCMDHVIGYYHVAKDTERVIREGPTGRLDQYLLCVAKIQKAVEYFQDNNPDSPELNTVKGLFEKGKEQLEAEFRSLLSRYSKPVPPVLILDALGPDLDPEDELELLQDEVVLEHLPESVLQDIICISVWLTEYGRNQDFMVVYYQVRSSQLDRSIKGLKDHLRKNSAPCGTLCSPAVQSKRKETPTKKVPKRPGTIRKAQNLLKQYSQLDGKKTGANVTAEGKDEVLDSEMDSYIHCISAFVKLAQSEYRLLSDIIPEHHHKKTFDSLIQEALDNLVLEGENIVSASRRNILRHDYSAVLSIFPVLRHLKNQKGDFDQVLQGTAASTKNKLPALITSMETIGARALEEFADSIKNDPDKEYNMPKDGTVHELTSNAILFLQQLLDFHETAGAMLASQESSSSSSYTSDFNKRLLSSYICECSSERCRLCPSVSSDCPSVSSDCPCVSSDCPSVSSDCPSVSSDCPSVSSDCLSVSSDCPSVSSDCPSVSSDCPSVSSDCPSVSSDCLSVSSDCPSVSSDCPSVSSDCPSVSSVCPSVSSDCPSVSSDCPSVSSDCPSVSSDCLSVSSDCPSVSSDCPSVL